jgi:hypothetical protein
MIPYKIARKTEIVKLGRWCFGGVLPLYLYVFLVLFSQMNRIKFVIDAMIE